MDFRLVPTWVTLNDLERRNSPYFALFRRPIMSQWLYNVRKTSSPSGSTCAVLYRTGNFPVWSDRSVSLGMAVASTAGHRVVTIWTTAFGLPQRSLARR